MESPAILKIRIGSQVGVSAKNSRPSRVLIS